MGWKAGEHRENPENHVAKYRFWARTKTPARRPHATGDRQNSCTWDWSVRLNPPLSTRSHILESPVLQDVSISCLGSKVHNGWTAAIWGRPGERRLSARGSRPLISTFPVLGHLAFGAASARRWLNRVHRPLRVDPPDVDIRRTVEPAAWVRPRTGIASQPASASGEQDRQPDQAHTDITYRSPPC